MTSEWEFISSLHKIFTQNNNTNAINDARKKIHS
jgi:hypothetical protein